MELVASPDFWMAVLTLSLLEIVLGIDNVVFISVIVQPLPYKERKKARYVGLSLAMLMRILLLLFISYILTLQTPLFTLFEVSFSIKSLILLAGGLFLIGKATHEIHLHLFEIERKAKYIKVRSSFIWIISQIIIIDIIFSLDSVITAVGVTSYIEAMVIAIVLSVIVMLLASEKISKFIEKYPTLKVLALAFLILIGVMLLAESIGQSIPKGYIYFAMLFSLSIEAINIISKQKEQQHK